MVSAGPVSGTLELHFSNQVGKSNLFLSGVCDGPRLGMLVPRGKRGAGGPVVPARN